jgi:PAS domain S-box-containing protein
MNNRRKISLQGKLIRTSMVTSLLALVLAAAAFMLTDYIYFRQNMRSAMISLATVVGRNSQAALLFDDRQAARDTLGALATVPNIVTAAILDLERNTFARFSPTDIPSEVNPPPEAPSDKVFSFHKGLAVVDLPILLENEPLGWVHLTAGLQGLWHHLRTYGLICVLILLCTATLAFLLSSRLQRRVSKPILELATTMSAVSDHKDYSLRQANRSDDEIGILIDGFNAMLDQLQMRDRDLRLTQFAIDSCGDAVFFINDEGQITYANHAASNYFGYRQEELLRMNITRIDPDLTATDRRSLRQSLEKNGPQQFEARHRRKSGECFPVEVSANLLIFEGHRYNCTFIRDITKRKRMAEQLQQAKKMETLGNLAAGVAHDLNNILGGLVSYPELLLLEMPPEDPLCDPLETIQKSGQKAADIVQDLLTLSRRGVAVTEVVDLNTLINEYLLSPEFAKLKRQHPEVFLETDLADDLLNLKGSSIHISKTIMNLVSNAAEAMPSGGELLLATCNRYMEASDPVSNEVPEGEYVQLKVSDTGVGISAEDRDRIFEPYFTKKKMGSSGTGLGMSVVWATVQDHRGTIQVASEEGHGTQFDLLFPATREAADKVDDRFVLEEFQGTASILVVDDVEEQRTIACKMLSKLGYQVETVPSGEKALERLRERRFELVVLDMIMAPGLDGLETYERMLTLAPGQRAIIASGFSESERVHQMQQMGAGDYLKKPYTLEKLAKTVRSALAQPH